MRNPGSGKNLASQLMCAFHSCNPFNVWADSPTLQNKSTRIVDFGLGPTTNQ